jgi:flagellar biosynthesis anti-sigma factor FlgM
MKIRGDNVGGKTVQQSGSKGQVSAGKSASTKAGATSSSDSSDKVSLTAAAKVEELIGHIEDLPIVDASRVGDIQQQLGTGSYVADDKNAAENLLEIEKELSAKG